MPEAAAVFLNANLEEAIGLSLADGLDSQTRRVGVRSNHADWVSRAPLRADGEGDDGGAVAGEKIFPTGLKGGVPGVFLLLMGCG